MRSIKTRKQIRINKKRAIKKTIKKISVFVDLTYLNGRFNIFFVKSVANHIAAHKPSSFLNSTWSLEIDVCTWKHQPRQPVEWTQKKPWKKSPPPAATGRLHSVESSKLNRRDPQSTQKAERISIWISISTQWNYEWTMRFARLAVVSAQKSTRCWTWTWNGTDVNGMVDWTRGGRIEKHALPIDAKNRLTTELTTVICVVSGTCWSACLFCFVLMR